MNTVKLYRLTRDKQTIEVMYAKCTQSTKTNNKWQRKQTLPLPPEVYRWAAKNGWSRKKPGALPTKKSEIALAVRKALR